MKKLYNQPMATLEIMYASDVLTNSADTFYSSKTNVDENDVYNFDQFI